MTTTIRSSANAARRSRKLAGGNRCKGGTSGFGRGAVDVDAVGSISAEASPKVGAPAHVPVSEALDALPIGGTIGSVAGDAAGAGGGVGGAVRRARTRGA